MKNLVKKLFEIQNREMSFTKTAENPFFHSKYLPLDELQTELLPVLREFKLLVFHYTKDKQVITRVQDCESDDFIESWFPIQDGLEPQKVGSTITYAKRYNLGQLFNIITDEDDDGNASLSSPKPRQAIIPPKRYQDSTPVQNGSPATHICSKCGSAPRTSKTTGKMYCPNSYSGDKKIAGHTIIERDEKIIQLDEKDSQAEDAFLANMGI